MPNTMQSDPLAMPILKPIRIRTKELGFLRAQWRWATRIRWWDLMADWRYTLSDGHEIVIPKDFQFDGASIPRIFRTFLSPVGILLLPGLAHDFAYRYDYLLEQSAPGAPYTRYSEGAGRANWDNLFREISTEINGFLNLNRFIWLALRIGGWWSWGKKRKNPAKPYWPANPSSQPAVAAP